MVIEAVIFDFIGTLATVEGYAYEPSVKRMYETLRDVGFNMDYEHFMQAYEKAHQKYRAIRYQELVEVTNVVWLSEALNSLGFTTNPEEENVRKAINIFFKDYIRSLRRRNCATRTLKKLSKDGYALGLISNFTYAPVIHAGLRKLNLSQFFNAILVSEDVGWRKPHPRIFKEALKRLDKKADQTVFVGDSPVEDIKGAKDVGMRTIFVPSQFFTVEDAQKAPQQPDIILNELCKLPEILSSKAFLEV